MPSTSFKDLYWAKSLQDLDVYTVIESAIQQKSTKLIANSASKVFKDAEKCHAEHDEEKAYVQYMRFVELVLILKKHSDFKKESNYRSIVEKANVALSKAEELKDSLRKRYSALQIVSPEEIEKDIIVTELPNNEPEVSHVISEAYNDIKEKIFITSPELLTFLSSPQTSISIMDIRPRKEFLDSHIKHSCCINVPQDILKPGLTAATLESLLPNESLSLWYKRADLDWIILMDFDSKTEALENNYLNILKAAMSKWDQKTLKRAPVILKGGYKDWMAKFPMHTTKAIHFDEASDLKFSPVLANLSDIEYPNLDENDAIEHLNEKNSNEKLFKKTFVSVSTPNDIVPSASLGSRKLYSAPAVDRKNKPNIPVNVHTKPTVNSTKISSYSALNRKITPVSNKKIPPPVDRASKNTVSHSATIKNSYIIDSPDDDLPVEKEKQEFMNTKLKNKDDTFKKNLIHNDLRAEEHDVSDVLKNQDVKPALTDDDNVFLMKKQEKNYPPKNAEEETPKNQKIEDEKGATNLSKEKPPSSEREEKKKTNVANYTKREVSSAKPMLPGNSSNSDSKKYNVDANKPSNISNSSSFVPQSSQNSSEISNKGLVRSYSSPNITQLLEEEEEEEKENRHCKIPTIDRSLKPKVTMQLSEINRARQRNLNPVYGNCPVRPTTGLKNLGNTCFMNSVIQCLSNTIPLANYIMSGQYVEHISWDNKHSTGGELVEEFAAVIKALWMGQYKSIYPKDFKNTVSRCLAVCIGNEQQDSHEFLVVLMEKLHADLNRRHLKVIPKLDPNCSEAAFWQHHKSYNSSRISDIFDGMLKSTLTCLSCGKTSNSFEVSTCLSLPILTSKCTLKDCFKHFLKPEKISGEAAWDCPRCKQKKEAEKRLSICRLPEVLIIQLKRFSYEGLWRRKLQTNVDFDLNFNVPYEENSHEYSRSYSLYGIVNHYGTLEGGHYTAYCRTNPGKWFKYDDHEVSEISSSDIKTSAAYLLFYITSDFQSRL